MSGVLDGSPSRGPEADRGQPGCSLISDSLRHSHPLGQPWKSQERMTLSHPSGAG